VIASNVPAATRKTHPHGGAAARPWRDYPDLSAPGRVPITPRLRHSPAIPLETVDSRHCAARNCVKQIGMKLRKPEKTNLQQPCDSGAHYTQQLQGCIARPG
jgi:hypothetical protein